MGIQLRLELTDKLSSLTFNTTKPDLCVSILPKAEHSQYLDYALYVSTTAQFICKPELRSADFRYAFRPR